MDWLRFSQVGYIVWVLLHQMIFRLHAHDFANVDKKQSDAAIRVDFGFEDLSWLEIFGSSRSGVSPFIHEVSEAMSVEWINGLASLLST